MSKDPYKVLGVSPDADDEAVKKAYRDLARKYHPDRYQGSDLADLAAEKMKEINAAYEEIQRERAGQPASGGAGGWSGQTGGAGARSHTDYSKYSTAARDIFLRVRRLIDAGDIAEAAQLLGQVAEADRGAEWFFLTGCIQLRKGYYADAQRSFETAHRMDPTNNEYWTFKENMRTRARHYGSGYDTSSGGACSGCDICSGLICADCCCECMGGDLIPCC